MSSLLIFKCPMSNSTMKHMSVILLWWYTDVYQTMKNISGKLKTMKKITTMEPLKLN
jgi:hypothetical protein